MGDRVNSLWAELGRAQREAALATKKVLCDMHTLGTGAMIITDEGEAKYQPIESMFDLRYQAEVDISEALRVPAEVITSGSYERLVMWRSKTKKVRLMTTGEHWSDCAQHNEPAMPSGPCDCGGDAPDSCKYQRREIGESSWEDCTKSQFEYCDNHPLYDTRKIQQVTHNVGLKRRVFCGQFKNPC